MGWECKISITKIRVALMANLKQTNTTDTCRGTGTYAGDRSVERSILKDNHMYLNWNRI